MKNTLTQIGINYKRIVFRNRTFFFFSLALPVIFFELFTKVMNNMMPTSYVKTYLVSMVVYSAVISSLLTVANTLLEDREKQFTLFVQLTGSSSARYYGTMAAVFLPLTILSIVVLGLFGTFVNNISLSPLIWLVFIVILPILTIPLVLMGILISFVGSSNAVNAVGQITMFFLAIVGGLWWPVSLMPSWLQPIGKCLPSYQIATFISELVNKQTVQYGNLIGWGLWIVGLLIALAFVFRLVRVRETQTI